MRCPYDYDCLHCPAPDCVVDFIPCDIISEDLRINRDLKFRSRVERCPAAADLTKVKPFRGKSDTYYSRNREKQLVNAKLYYYENRMTMNERQKEYYQQHLEERRSYQREYYRKKKSLLG